MNHYIKLIGFAEDPLPVEWVKERPEVVNGVRFGDKRRPPVSKGDRVIYYAVGRQRFCGILEVLSDCATKDNPDTEPWEAWQKEKWPWWVGLKPIILLPADERSPHVGEVGFDVKRIIHKGYLKITQGEFEKLEQAIRQRSASNPSP